MWRLRYNSNTQPQEQYSTLGEALQVALTRGSGRIIDIYLNENEFISLRPDGLWSYTKDRKHQTLEKS